MKMLEKQEDLRGNIAIIDIEGLVPAGHLLRKIEASIDFNKIYPMVEKYYSNDVGRHSVDPVVLFKIALIQHLYGIRSMRQTVKEIEVNMAYRWFLHFDFHTHVPHFATLSYAFAQRFPEGVFENIFYWILEEACKKNYLKEEVLFVDGTHVKANANKKKNTKKLIEDTAKAYTKKLTEEINHDREQHNKKPLKGKDDSQPPKMKEVTVSETDPESGLFRKGEHKVVFAYNANVACDANGFIHDFVTVAGNINDSTSFDALLARLKVHCPRAKTIVADAGYKTPWICKEIADKNMEIVLPYTRPKGIAGMFTSRDFVYDEYYDCVLCPNNQVLEYVTTNREGRKVFKSNPAICCNCPLRTQCTARQTCQKVHERHIWNPHVEAADELRYTKRGKELYAKRKQTIERVFADGKEKYGLRYSPYKGLVRVTKWLRLKFAAMNLKKMAIWDYKNLQIAI